MDSYQIWVLLIMGPIYLATILVSRWLSLQAFKMTNDMEGVVPFIWLIPYVNVCVTFMFLVWVYTFVKYKNLQLGTDEFIDWFTFGKIKKW